MDISRGRLELELGLRCFQSENYLGRPLHLRASRVDSRQGHMERLHSAPIQHYFMDAERAFFRSYIFRSAASKISSKVWPSFHSTAPMLRLKRKPSRLSALFQSSSFKVMRCSTFSAPAAVVLGSKMRNSSPP